MSQSWTSVSVPAAEPAETIEQVRDRAPLMVRMSDFTDKPGEWMATARQRPVLLLRHGRPVGLLRPGHAHDVDRCLDVTVFARQAKTALAAGRANLTRYGSPYYVVSEPVTSENFEGWILARSGGLLADLEENRGEAQTSAAVAAELGLPLDDE